MSVNSLLERQDGYIAPAFNTERGQRRATDVSRRAYYQSLAAMLQTRMNDVIRLAYDVGPRGIAINVDIHTERLLFGVPWARNSHRKWALYRSESDIMGMVVRAMSVKRNGAFYYDGDARRWCLDLNTYPTMAALMATPSAFTIEVDDVIVADARRRAAQRA